jgi:hypothetical protein
MVEPGKRRWMVAVMLALPAGCSNTADQAMPAVDPFEEPLVADGIVTDAEYEQAVRAEASCVAEALDVEIEGPRWLADGSRYEYQYVVTGSEEDNERAIAVEAACHAKHRDAVGWLWSRQRD